MINKIIAALVAFTLIASPVSAIAGNMRVIRDAETEDYLRDISKPIMRAAGLYPKHIDIVIIQDDNINAFVSGGQNIYVHTGLITQSDDAAELIGVLAHEIGHIAGGHLTKKGDEYKRSTIGMAIGYILGIASVAAGAPASVGSAIASSSQHITQRNFLRFSRQHEASADQAAMKYLKTVGVSPRGLIDMMAKLGRKTNLMLPDHITPYMLTHPMSDERISHLKSYIRQNPSSDVKTRRATQLRHKRIVAKLDAFLDDPDKSLHKYSNSSDASIYARAVAYHRLSDYNKAISNINRLVSKYPRDPFYIELKGQIAYEHGKMKIAVSSYKKASSLRSKDTLLKLQLALAYLGDYEQSSTRNSLNKARDLLEIVVADEPYNAIAWQRLGIAYGQLGDLGRSYLALAESSYIRGKKSEVKRYLKYAKPHKDQDNVTKRRYNDLKRALKNMDNKKKKFF